MAEDEVSVDGSKLSIVERCRERLQQLFGVTSETLFIALGNDGPCKIRLHAAGSSPQKSLEKAKRYLKAVVGDTPSVSCRQIKYSLEDFDMVRKYHDQIESITQAFLEFQSHCVVRIQGNQIDINSAADYINSLLSGDSLVTDDADEDDISSLTVSCGDIDSYHSNPDSGLLSPNVPDFLRSDEAVTDTTGSTNSSQSGLSRLDVGLITRGAAPDMPRAPVTVVQGDTCSSLGSSPLSSRSLSPESDLTSKPEYNAKLEKAMKLGYSEEQLIYALRKLGFDADQNQVLSEMIKLGSSSKVGQEEVKVTDDKIDSFDEELTEKRKKDVIDDSSNLRHIVIDGSNVAMSHGKDVFSCHGIKLAVDWFRERGHEQITVFVPQWRKETSRPDAPITDQEILLQLEKEKILSFTPARRVGGRRMVCYDDRYILNLAVEEDGIVVSNDNYRDLVNEKPEFKKVVEERLLMYTFASNRFMPPDDPLGRRGPTLDNFLRKEPTVPEPLPPECPYGKKCTYGNKCRYYHPERKNQPHQLITDKLREQAKQWKQERASRPLEAAPVHDKKKIKDPDKKVVKKPLTRTQSVFPEGLSDGIIALTKMTTLDSSEQIRTDRQDLYNEKLNEARKTYERAMYDKAELNRLAHSSEVPKASHPILGRRTSSYDYGSAQEANQLKVPLSQPNEGLVSGHLLLAKKLSDEAQDSNFFRPEGSVSSDEPRRASPQPFVYPGSPQRPPSHLPTAGIADIPYHGQDQVRRMITGRGRSPRHVPHDPGVCHSGPSVLMRQDASSVSSLDYGEHCRSFPLPPSEFMPHHHRAVTHDHMMYPGHPDDMYEHSTVNRYPSAPGPTHLHMSVGHTMQRQNSTSDPQLHMVGADGEPMARPGLVKYHESEKINLPGFPRSSSNPQQINPFHPSLMHQSSEASYSQGQGYPYIAWGEATSDMMPSAGMRPIQKTYHSVPTDQYTPAGQERKLSTDYWNRSSLPLSPNPQQHPHPYNPQASMMPNHPYQQQPIHQQMPVTPMSHQQMTYQQSPQFAPDTPIEVSDPRYTLYYHLCGLFPPAKVAAVMHQHPQERDPKVLCQYIMSLGERI